jgi:hypothetical protein
VQYSYSYSSSDSHLCLQNDRVAALAGKLSEVEKEYSLGKVPHLHPRLYLLPISSSTSSISTSTPSYSDSHLCLQDDGAAPLAGKLAEVETDLLMFNVAQLSLAIENTGYVIKLTQHLCRA